jgi:hypothetical protein
MGRRTAKHSNTSRCAYLRYCRGGFTFTPARTSRIVYGRPEWLGKLRRLSRCRWAWKSTCTPAQRANNRTEDCPAPSSDLLLRAVAGARPQTQNTQTPKYTTSKQLTGRYSLLRRALWRTQRSLHGVRRARFLLVKNTTTTGLIPARSRSPLHPGFG